MHALKYKFDIWLVEIPKPPSVSILVSRRSELFTNKTKRQTTGGKIAQITETVSRRPENASLFLSLDLGMFYEQLFAFSSSVYVCSL
jgi:hypothetical protein